MVNKEMFNMKKYEAPQIEITPIYNSSVLTTESGGPFDLPEDEY